MNSSSNTPLFCGWSEKRIAKRTVQQILKAYLRLVLNISDQVITKRLVNLKKAIEPYQPDDDRPKRDGTNPHTLRHTFATFCVTSGVPLRMIQKYLMHTSIKTTEVYAAASEELIKTENITNPEYLKTQLAKVDFVKPNIGLWHPALVVFL